MGARTHAISRTLEHHRREIVGETLLVLSNFGLLIYFVDGAIPAGYAADRALHLAYSVLIVLVGSTLLIASGLLVVKTVRARRRKSDERALPEIMAELIRIARGHDNYDLLRRLHEQAPRAAERALGNVLAAQKGSSLANLASAAEACGIPARWRHLTESGYPNVRCRAIIGLGLLPGTASDAEFHKALADPEELVGLEAARALIRSGRTDVIEELFFDLPRQTRLDRALISEWMRKHSTLLAERAVPQMLQSANREDVLTALEVLRSWKRALGIPKLPDLLEHHDAEICAAAWNVVPYALGLEVTEPMLLLALKAESPQVRASALQTCASMRLAFMPPHLERAVSDPVPEVGLAAAYSMGALGMRRDLERIASSGTPVASTCAMEALEKLSIGRMAT